VGTGKKSRSAKKKLGIVFKTSPHPLRKGQVIVVNLGGRTFKAKVEA